MRISDWSSDVCSSDLRPAGLRSGNSGLCRASGCLLEQTWPQSFCDLAQMRVARAAAASKNVHMRVAGMQVAELHCKLDRVPVLKMVQFAQCHFFHLRRVWSDSAQSPGDRKRTRLTSSH